MSEGSTYSVEMKASLLIMVAVLVGLVSGGLHCTGKANGCRDAKCDARPTCSDGAVEVPGDEVCRCCPACAVYLDEGDPCSTRLDNQIIFRLCRPPLECNGTCKSVTK
ncbi:uncharacterized protein [Periplaneta americana]|uniref:uncharacterized protein isoform X2 n=1 Tax=Periplaneta americana TaxID=6978 RepID=UPI0037E81762